MVSKISKQSTGIKENETTNESEKKAQQKKKDIQLLTFPSNPRFIGMVGGIEYSRQPLGWNVVVNRAE